MSKSQKSERRQQGRQLDTESHPLLSCLELVL